MYNSESSFVNSNYFTFPKNYRTSDKIIVGKINTLSLKLYKVCINPNLPKSSNILFA